MLRWDSVQLPLLFYGILITRCLLDVVLELSGIDPFHLISCATRDWNALYQYSTCCNLSARNHALKEVAFTSRGMHVLLASAAAPLSLLDCFKIVVALLLPLQIVPAQKTLMPASVLMYTDCYPTATG